MELNKENIKKIIGIITFGIILFFLLQNISVLKDGVFNFLDILSPFLYGAGFAFVLNIPMSMFERKLFKTKKGKDGKVKKNKLQRPVSILLAIILITFILGFVIKLVIPQLLEVIFMFIKQVPSWAYNTKEWAIDLTEQYPDISSQIQNVEINWESVTNDLIGFAKNFAGSLVTSSVSIVMSLIGGIFDTIISIVFAIYILISKEKLQNQATKLVRAYFPKRRANYILEICSLSKTTFYNFITGQCTEAVIIGTLCFIGMLILRLPFAITISILIGVTALIPIIGAFLGAIIGALLILSVSPVKALVFVIFLIILQQIESNAIYPKVVGNSVGLPGMWVLMAVVVGGGLFGVLGLLLGLPALSVLYTILRNDVNKRVKDKAET